jgi:fucose 4-O-acetylase-like acetyltransferase
MAGKSRFNFWLDATVFSAFYITAITGLLLWLVIPSGRGSGNIVSFGLTRHAWLDVHQWVGLVLLAGMTLHLVLHWKWIVCVSRRYFGRLARQARLNFSLNSLLFAAFLLVNLSGLLTWLVLPSGGYRGGRNPLFNVTWLGLTRHEWNDLHLWAGLAMMIIITIHLALHWRWLSCAARRYAQVGLCRVAECAVD